MSDDISIPGPTYRVPRHRRGLDPSARQRVAIAAGLFGSLLVAGAAWSLLHHRGHDVPVVQADAGPLRVKPENPGGLQVATAGNEIFSGGSDTTVDKLAPPPETPDLQALRAPPPPVLKSAVQQPAETPAVAVVPPPPAPKAAAPSMQPAKAAPAVAAPASSAHTARNALVQLAALSSEQAAKTEWANLARRMPDLLGGKQPAFSKFERDGRTYWRVRTGGFADAAQASAFCTRLRAKGASCSVADF